MTSYIENDNVWHRINYTHKIIHQELARDYFLHANCVSKSLTSVQFVCEFVCYKATLYLMKLELDVQFRE